MKSFYRSAKNNRSQHNLVGSTVAEDSSVVSSSVSVATPTAGAPGPNATTPSSALSNPPFSSSESFPVESGTGRTTHPQSSPPPPHLVNNIYTDPTVGPSPNVTQLQHSNTVTGALDSRQKTYEYADQVTRSQSHRFSQVSPTSTHQQQFPLHHQQLQQHPPPQQTQQQQQQLHPGSASIEDLSGTGNHNISPVAGQPQQPPPKKQSTRKLIKNILSGSTSSSRGPDQYQQHHSHSSHGHSSSVNRRSSKRISQPPPPPSIRTGVSQVSLDQQQPDWQSQPPLPSQPSPLQGTGEFQDQYFINGPAQESHLPNHPHDLQQSATIRPVPSESAEASPYSADDVGYHQHQGQIQIQGQAPLDFQRQQYGQTVFDPSQQQHQHQHQQQPPYQFANSQELQYQIGNQQAITGHLSNPQQQNPETISQLSRESPATDSDQVSVTNIQPTQSSSALSYNPQSQDIPGHSNPPAAQALIEAQAQGQAPQQQSMAPPPGGPPPPRRSQETEKGIRDQQGQPPPGPPPSYRQSQQSNMNPLPPAPNVGGQNPTYRQSAVPDRQQFDGAGDVQGRNSPQPSAGEPRAEDQEKAFKDLLQKYKNVKRLYFDGKKEIEQLNSQVEQLQNAIANQRMSRSRTSLDDSEYATRFNRLNGAITNLSFNIRKDWVTLPSWISQFVSADALKTGKQEMTAVGRAVITRWVVEEIFNRCFHPGLEPELSRQLKTIEHNIRHFSYTMNSQEEFDALTSKVVSWRMATLEGLQDVLRSGESANHKADFTQRATSNLTASLFQHLTDPPPAGVDGSASMIVELAVGLASNIPLESRDVAIIYPLPEQQIRPDVMEVEKSGLPPLENRPSEASEEGSGTADDGAKDAKEQRRSDKTRSGMLNTIAGSGPSGPDGRKRSVADASSHAAGAATAPVVPPKDAGKIRFAGFVGVEVRGRHVLVKAPVWTLG